MSKQTTFIFFLFFAIAQHTWGMQITRPNFKIKNPETTGMMGSFHSKPHMVVRAIVVATMNAPVATNIPKRAFMIKNTTCGPTSKRSLTNWFI